MLDIKLNQSNLIFKKGNDKLFIRYALDKSAITFELIEGEIKLLLDWCDKFPCDFDLFCCFSAISFIESISGMPVIAIDKDGYKARINLTKRNLQQISEYVRGVK